jgi:hypothetical protein
LVKAPTIVCSLELTHVTQGGNPHLPLDGNRSEVCLKPVSTEAETSLGRQETRRQLSQEEAKGRWLSSNKHLSDRLPKPPEDQSQEQDAQPLAYDDSRKGALIVIHGSSWRSPQLNPVRNDLGAGSTRRNTEGHELDCQVPKKMIGAKRRSCWLTSDVEPPASQALSVLYICGHVRLVV